ncbi:hypothetical protein Acr_28g0001870 [Actinidia rufa]|uniref:Uncharacterized protein n=1 Tax=Actinidia rufa TaxID=165716 RepID=A0A7J0H8Q6_9ERIC|nr:hypothetical protein Acr_28g0001870 [Actinidia rufa]
MSQPPSTSSIAGHRLHGGLFKWLRTRRSQIVAATTSTRKILNAAQDGGALIGSFGYFCPWMFAGCVVCSRVVVLVVVNFTGDLMVTVVASDGDCVLVGGGCRDFGGKSLMGWLLVFCEGVVYQDIGK